jgi:hypothetical protein
MIDADEIFRKSDKQKIAASPRTGTTFSDEFASNVNDGETKGPCVPRQLYEQPETLLQYIA